MADTAPETVVPVKVPEPEDKAPPTLAEPASGAVAEMSGALPEKSPETAAAAPPATEEATTNGDAQPAAETTATDSAPVASEKPTEPATAADNDTEMKEADAAEPSTAEDVTAAADTNGATASKQKRKSTSGVPEHKGKTLKKKQSKAKLTNLDAQPGDYFFARLRSYPPWPAIICDEDMLPETLLKSRPVTAMQKDGTYREPYVEGGKKVNDRTFPIMFLHTNEFAWLPNTDLTPLKPEECKDVNEKGKTKALIEAYRVAAEGHELQHFKEMIEAHIEAMQADEDAKLAKEAEKVAKADKKKRKSDVKATSDDVEMEDADAEPKKSSKKRKKDPESDDEAPEKAAKTPKTKIKLNAGKTPTTAEKKEKKTPKPKADKKKKKGDASDEEAAEPEEKEQTPLDPVQARKEREKEVLFLRHKLQKGFLSRDQAPQEHEMPQMATYIKKLEGYGDKLEPAIIRNTKIHKVLKALVKLNTVPKDEEFHFRERSIQLLGIWNQLLGAEPGEAEKLGKDEKASPTTTNGVHKEAEEKAEEKIESAVEEPKDEVMEPSEAVEKISAEAEVDAGAKAEAIDAIEKQEDPADAQTANTEEIKKDDVPVVEDKAPESAPAAAEAAEVVKAAE